MALSQSIDIWGRFHDLISGPIGRAISAMTGLERASRRAAAAANSNALMMNTRQLNSRTAAFSRHAAAIDSVTAAQRRYTHSLNSHTSAVHRSNRTGGWFGGRGGGGGHRSAFTPYQQSLAALGGYGYALGRGGPQVLGVLGSGFVAQKSWKEFATYESLMADLRKAANLTRPEMERMGRSLRNVAIDNGIPAEDVAKMATEWALGGARGEGLITALSAQSAKAKLVWSGVPSDKVANTLAKMQSLWFRDMDPSKVPARVSSVIDAIDYLEDNFPTKAEEILKAFERFMPVAKGSGMTPEQVAAVATSLMVSGPGSGERGGTRLAINWRRMEGAIEGSIKKRGFKITDTATPEVKKAIESNTMLGVYMWMDNLRKKFKGEKGWQKKAGDVIAKGLGFESSKNVEPLMAEFGTTLQIGSTFNQGVARWATKQGWFRDKMKSLGEDGERLLKTLDDYAAAVDGVDGPWVGWAARSLAIQKDRAQYRTARLWESFKKLGDSIGGIVDEYLKDEIGHLEKTVQDIEERVNKHKEGIKKEREKRSPMFKVPTILGGERDATEEEWKEFKESQARTSFDNPPETAGGKKMQELYWRAHKWFTGAWPIDRFQFMPDGAMMTMPPTGRFDFAGSSAAEAFGAYVPGTIVNTPGVPPLPVRPGMTSWPTGVPTGPPSIINQHMGGEPIVNQIPPPQVNVINSSPGVVNVNVSVSPAMQTIMRNPGTAAQSGSQNDTAGSKTGVVGR